MSWLYPVAEENGLLVAYPEAAGDYWNTPNSPPAYWNVPDVPFVDAVVDDVDGRYGVDRARVYVAGSSNGAVFAQLVACTRGDRIAGLAVVGAGAPRASEPVRGRRRAARHPGRLRHLEEPARRGPDQPAARAALHRVSHRRSGGMDPDRRRPLRPGLGLGYGEWVIRSLIPRRYSLTARASVRVKPARVRMWATITGHCSASNSSAERAL